MDDKNGFLITNRDRVLKSWQDSTELVRDYKTYAHELDDDPALASLFADYAETEAEHASKFLGLLREFEQSE